MYIYEITCIKHRCHFSLRSQLAEWRALASQPLAEFSPALSLSGGKETVLSALSVCVYAGPRENTFGGSENQDEDSGPTCFRG